LNNTIQIVFGIADGRYRGWLFWLGVLDGEDR
jgi:hypothetical protein